MMPFNRWRVVVRLRSSETALLYLALTSDDAKAHYREPWFGLLRDEVRQEAAEVLLQKWYGDPGCGVWRTQANLAVPHPPRKAV